MKAYALPTGTNDHERLDIQHLCYCEGNYSALKASGIEAGQTVIDVGCGAGAMTEWLAHQVGPRGKVFALDNSAEQLDITRERIHKAGLTHVEFIEFNLEHDLELALDADITYCSMVLGHLKNQHNGIQHLVQFTRKGGTVIAVDPINSQHWCTPNHPTFHKLFELYIHYATLNQFDADFGQQLFDLFKQSNYFSTITCHGYQPVTSNPHLKSYLMKGWEHIKETLVQQKIITQQEQTTYSKELNELIYSPHVTVGLPVNTIVKGRVG